MECGLSQAEARELSFPEMLCMLHHAAFEQRIRRLESELDRVAALPLADPHEQMRSMLALRQRMALEIERFYSPPGSREQTRRARVAR